MDTAAAHGMSDDNQPVISRPVRLGQQPARVPSRDGRSAEARLVRRVREELTKHVGGKPSATQKALIARASMLAMHLARMDTRAVQEGGFSEHASREYLAWSNTFTRTMAALGMQAASARAPDIRALMAERAAALGGAGGGQADIEPPLARPFSAQDSAGRRFQAIVWDGSDPKW